MLFGKYNRIDTIEKLQALDAYLMNEDGTNKYPIMAVDTETNGLLLHKSTVIGFSVSVDKYTGFYLPLLDWNPTLKSLKTRTIDKVKYDSYMDGNFKCVWTGLEYPEFVKPKEYPVPEFIPAFVARWFSGANLIMHNAPFDVNMIYVSFGIDLKDNLLVDTSLLSHIINENSPNGLKKVAEEFKEELGFNPHVAANMEQQELKHSIILNGGKGSEVWRADPKYMFKYASSDTFLTFGIYEVLMQRLYEDFGEEGVKWVFEDEVMPLCKEVVIEMKRRGVYLDIPHFELLFKETGLKLRSIEDEIIAEISHLLGEFPLGQSHDEAISNQRLIKRIAQLEGLALPQKHDKKTDTYKESLAKPEVKKAYENNPHWLWGYILGEDEIKYSQEKLAQIKAELYEEVEGRRYRFNIGSDFHLRWLFCDKLGISKRDLPQTDSATKDNPIPSMAAEVLEEQILPKFPWVRKLLTYKRLMKLQGTYISTALELNIDGWLYMDMKQNGTVAGRFACSGGFNLQTLPKVEEFETCPKCGSRHLKVENTILLLANVTCGDCGHVQHDQLCPSAIKKGFIAPPGYKIINADFSSLEPRCFAFVAGEEKIKQVYWENLDLYSKVYIDMFDKEGQYSAHPDAPNFLKKLNKAARNLSKVITLAIPYGSRKGQVANLLDKKKTVTYKDGTTHEVLDVEYGQQIINTYLDAYPALRMYMENQELKCLIQGWVQTKFGRKRHFQYAPVMYRYLTDWFSKCGAALDVEELIEYQNKRLVGTTIQYVTSSGYKVILDEILLRQICKECGLKFDDVRDKEGWLYLRNLMKNELNNAKNAPIQGLAAHIANKSMLDTARYIRAEGLNGWVCLQVHDELTAYAPELEAQRTSELLQHGMEKNEYALSLDVPMIAEPIICDNLKDSK